MPRNNPWGQFQKTQPIVVFLTGARFLTTQVQLYSLPHRVQCSDTLADV